MGAVTFYIYENSSKGIIEVHAVVGSWFDWKDASTIHHASYAFMYDQKVDLTVK
jgi:hypothetical protein